MLKETELKPNVVLSQGSLPPQISIFSSSERLGEILPKTGAEGIELLPFWGVTLEVLVHGELKSPEAVESFHQTWRTDRKLEKKYGAGTRFVDHLFDFAFPPTSLTNIAMGRLWSKYPDRPTVIHGIVPENTLGREDTLRFYLELAHQNGIQLPELRFWIGEKPQLRGIAYPIRDDQFEGWRERYGGEKRNSGWEEMTRELISEIKSVHFGPLSTAEIQTALNGDRQLTASEEKVKALYEMGFGGDVVIEVSPLKIRGRNFEALKAIAGRLKDIRDEFCTV